MKHKTSEPNVEWFRSLKNSNTMQDNLLQMINYNHSSLHQRLKTRNSKLPVQQMSAAVMPAKQKNKSNRDWKYYVRRSGKEIEMPGQAATNLFMGKGDQR